MSAIARFVYEFFESIRIAWAQIRANKMRSVLTALGVIIGIVAVTLMGTAIRGIDTGFNNSLAMLGDDVLYVEKWPWGPVEDWWNYANRPQIKITDAEKLNRIIESTPNSMLAAALWYAGLSLLGEVWRRPGRWDLRHGHHGGLRPDHERRLRRGPAVQRNRVQRGPRGLRARL